MEIYLWFVVGMMVSILVSAVCATGAADSGRTQNDVNEKARESSLAFFVTVCFCFGLTCAAVLEEVPGGFGYLVFSRA